MPFEGQRISSKDSCSLRDISGLPLYLLALFQVRSLLHDSAVQTVAAAEAAAAATTTKSRRPLDSGCTDSHLLHTRAKACFCTQQAPTGAEWDFFLDNKPDCSVFFSRFDLRCCCMIPKPAALGRISAGVVPLIYSFHLTMWDTGQAHRPKGGISGKHGNCLFFSLFIV